MIRTSTDKTIPRFPRLMKLEGDSELVVLFTGESKGVILQLSEGMTPTRLGTEESWCYESFEPFSGPLIIENI